VSPSTLKHQPADPKLVMTEPSVVAESANSRPGVIFVSFFTPRYAKGAAALRADLERLGLEYEIVARKKEPGEAWLKTCNAKLSHVREKLVERFPDAVCWLDCDVRVGPRPGLLFQIAEERGYDFAAYRHPGGMFGGGLLFFANTARAKALLTRAIQMVEADSSVTEIGALRKAMEDTPDLCRFRPLPPEYGFVPGLSHREHSGVKPVIVHLLKTSVQEAHR